MSDYKFYMQQVNADNTLGVIKDLEVDFHGLRYKECTGLEAKGKPRVYSESYSDSDELRMYIPPTITRDATTIALTLLFSGENRRDTFNSFYEYIKNGKFKYWDTARSKEALLVLNSEVSPSEDTLYGGVPYIQVQFKFQNLWGATKNKI